MENNQPRKPYFFSALAYLFFNRKRSLIFCIFYGLFSFLIEIKCGWPNFFSSSGAIISIAGLFLNIKYSLNFHLKIPMTGLYNKLSGAGVFGTNQITAKQEKWVHEILADEKFGVSFMIIGTVVWAYGSYLTGMWRLFFN